MELWKEYYIPELDLTVDVSNMGTIKTRDKIVSVMMNGKSYDRLFEGCIKAHVRNGKAGYYQVTFHNNGKSKKFYVHRLVWLSHVGEIPNNYEIDHDDDDKSNNQLSNLNLVTRQENMIKMHEKNPHVLDSLNNK